jgi:hypothetical protein
MKPNHVTDFSYNYITAAHPRTLLNWYRSEKPKGINHTFNVY